MSISGKVFVGLGGWHATTKSIHSTRPHDVIYGVLDLIRLEAVVWWTASLFHTLRPEVPLALSLLGYLCLPTYEMFFDSHFFHFPGFFVECTYGVLSDWGNRWRKTTYHILYSYEITHMRWMHYQQSSNAVATKPCDGVF